MGGGHGFFAGPSSGQANAQAGLPYADVPEELRDRITDVLRHEPDHPDPEVAFSHSDWDRRPFGLRTFLIPHTGGLLVALILVVIETGLLHVGPLLTQMGIDQGVLAGDTGILLAIALAYLCAVALSTCASFLRTRFTGRLGERLVCELRIRVFSHYQRQSLDFFTGEKSGVLMTRMTSDIEALTVLLQEGLVNFVVQGMTLLVITTYLLVLHPGLALVCLLTIIPINVVLTLWFRRVSHVGYLRVRDRIADVLSNLAESLAGIRVITAFGRRDHDVARHQQIIDAHLNANLYTGRAQALFGPGTESIGIIAQAVVLLVGGRMALRGEVTIGELAAFLLFLTSFFAPVQTLVQLYNQYQQGSAAVLKLRELLSTEPTVMERPDAADLPPIEGRIRFDSVTFGYDADHLVLRDVDLELEPGEVLAVVGPTGAGKSTIAKLVTRFHDPTFGHHHRRPRPTRRRHYLATPPIGRRSPGTLPVQRDHRRQRVVLPSGSHPRGSGRGLSGRRSRPAPRPDARRCRHPHSRTGCFALSGRAPTRCTGPGVPGPPQGPGARRGHLQPGPPVRIGDRTGAGPGPRRAHGHPHRPPPSHSHASRPGGSGRRRKDHRARNPHRVAGPRRAIRGHGQDVAATRFRESRS